MAFLSSDAPFRGLCGGRGSGKTWCGAYDLLTRARCRGGTYLVASPTAVLMGDTTFHTVEALARDLCLWNPEAVRLTPYPTVTLKNGTLLRFRTAEDPDRLRGPNLSGIWLDEASLMERRAFDVAIGCLREAGRQGWLSATFTPRGRVHWTYDLFGKGGPDVACFHAHTADNPFLPPEFVPTLSRQYTTAQAAQELLGEFVDLAGALFRREWFRLLDVAPAGLALVRRWDLAATEVKPGRDPDWTAGVLMGRDRDNRYHVLDVRRTRTTAGGVEALVRQTAELDGRTVPVRMEQEPGSAGVALCDHYARNVLAGWDYRGVRTTGDKVTRAGPLAAQAEAGNVSLLRGPWVKDFLDEAETMPAGDHDDRVDAASGALQDLTGVPPAEFVIGTGAARSFPAGTFATGPGRTRFPRGVFGR